MSPDQANNIAQTIAGEYEGLDHRVVDRMVKLAQRLARCHKQDLSIETVRKALKYHAGKPV